MEKAFQVFQFTENSCSCLFFSTFFLFCFTALFFSLCEINCIKIQTISLVLNLSILAEILYVLFALTSSFASD